MLGLRFRKPDMGFDAAYAEVLAEERRDREKAFAFKGKILSALNERGIDPAMTWHLDNSLLIAALLLDVKPDAE